MLVVALALGVIAASFATPALSAGLAAILAVGFALRVYAGPKCSLFGQLSVRYFAKKVFGQPHVVSGAPKQFAQCIGLAFSGLVAVLALSGERTAMRVTLALLVLAASAETFLGFCAGCWTYRRQQRAGVIGPDACETCAI